MSDKRELKLAPNKASDCFVMRDNGPATHMSSMSWDVACAVQYTGWMMAARAGLSITQSGKEYVSNAVEYYAALRQAQLWATEGGWWPAAEPPESQQEWLRPSNDASDADDRL